MVTKSAPLPLPHTPSPLLPPAVTCLYVLCNDRVTDVVLVSMGRYPVLKNPFKLVKPLTRKTLGSECACVPECHYLSADCVHQVFVSLLINFDCKGEWRAFVEQKQQAMR